jgi:glycogen synthase
VRIAFMINVYPPYIVGGNEMITHDLVEILRTKGHDIHVLTARGERFDDIPHIQQVFNYNLDDKEAVFGGRELSLIELFRHHIFDLKTYRNVRRAVRQLQPDLIVVDNQFMASAAPLLAVRDMPCPVIAQAMDKWLVYYLVDWGLLLKPNTLPLKLFVRTVRESAQRLIARAVRLDGIATVSDFIKDYHSRAGFNPEKMQSVYLGYDSTVFQPGPSHPLHNPVQLIYAGALWKGKGPQVIIEALELLGQKENIPDFHLHIFGQGTERFMLYLRKVIKSAGVEQQVSLRGFVSWQELAEAMHKSDIFVFSSIWDEPFATVPLQAAGCGMPIVATRAGGTPEGFIHERTALLIPPDDPYAMADAIYRLVEDDALRRSLSKNAAKDARKRWSFEAYVSRFCDFCEEVTERWQ